MTERYSDNPSPSVEKIPIIRFDEKKRPINLDRATQGLSHAVENSGALPRIARKPRKYTALSGIAEGPTEQLSAAHNPESEAKKPSWIDTVDEVYDKSKKSPSMNLFRRKEK